MVNEWWRPSLAEFVGVFALVYIGAGSIVMTSYLGWAALGSQTLLVIAMAHGLAIATMVTALGHISGAHFNPAVTVAALFTKRIPTDMGLIYIAFQLLGGVFGAFLLTISFPDAAWQAARLGTPGINGALIDRSQGVFIEAVLTFFLVFVVFGAGVDPNNKGGFKAAGGLAIGLTVMMDILMGGPLTGGAMNPARHFGPALVSRNFGDMFVYWAGPLIGGILAGLLYDTAFLAKPAGDAEGSGSDDSERPPLDDGDEPDAPAEPADEGPAAADMSALEHVPEPEPDATPGGHDPTSLDDPKGS